MKHIRVAKRYALALFKTAKVDGSLDAVKADAELILSSILSARDFKAVLRSPVIQSWRKKNLLNAVFETRITPLTKAFLGVLCSKNREDITSEIFEQFYVLYNENFNFMSIKVTSAVELDSASRTAIESSVQQRFSKKPVADYYVDASLKGGLMVQIGDTLLDSSLRTQLQKMRLSLISDPHFLN